MKKRCRAILIAGAVIAAAVPGRASCDVETLEAAPVSQKGQDYMRWWNALRALETAQSAQGRAQATSLKRILDELGGEFEKKEFTSFSKEVDAKLAQRRQTLAAAPAKIAAAEKELRAAEEVLKTRYPDLRESLGKDSRWGLRLDRIFEAARYAPGGRKGSELVTVPLIERYVDLRPLRDSVRCYYDRFSGGGVSLCGSTKEERVYDYRTSPPTVTTADRQDSRSRCSGGGGGPL